MRFVTSIVFWVILFPAQPGTVLADGERDNNVETVRRIPKAGIVVPADRRDSLTAALRVLQQKLNQLSSSPDPAISNLMSDVMIFERAVRCALDYDEFFAPADLNKADQLLVEGIRRADQLLAGTPDWPNQSGLVVRGYISRIDHTVQPYGLVIPPTYPSDGSVPTRCDIWFHGRGETLSEVNFLWEHMKSAGRYVPDHTIVLHPYGRYSNAFKFAGETDVLEALHDVQQRYRIDEDRVSVRGFSMGGAACWQFATHYADRWFAANPGAGFSETPEFLRFFQKETLNPTPWEKQLWNLYDCNKWAINLTHCPTIAYSGENDIQKQAADVMEEALSQHGIRMRHVIGENMGHNIDQASKQTIETTMSQLSRVGRRAVPPRIEFQTYTLKYNRMHWLTVNSMRNHWREARVTADIGDFDAPALHLVASNVDDFTIRFPAGSVFPKRGTAGEMRIGVTSGTTGKSQAITVPGPLSDGSWEFRLRQSIASVTAETGAGESWKLVTSDRSGLHKRTGLQGPVDDAFMDSFVFVRSTGTAVNDAVGQWSDAELERAIIHWRRHFRGDARVVNDTQVTEELIQSANLVLWGDPSSNSVLAKIADQLPIQWNSDRLRVGRTEFDATVHAPILIYPNPLNPDRYVVLNSSFTFRDYAYLNNARQVPMLPDWAIVDLRTPPGNVWPGKVVAADFFDERWQLK